MNRLPAELLALHFKESSWKKRENDDDGDGDDAYDDDDFCGCDGYVDGDDDDYEVRDNDY